MRIVQISVIFYPKFPKNFLFFLEFPSFVNLRSRAAYQVKRRSRCKFFKLINRLLGSKLLESRRLLMNIKLSLNLAYKFETRKNHISISVAPEKGIDFRRKFIFVPNVILITSKTYLRATSKTLLGRKFTNIRLPTNSRNYTQY